MIMLTPASVLARHAPFRHVPYCSTCSTDAMAWPCDAVLMARALAESEERVKVLEGLANDAYEVMDAACRWAAYTTTGIRSTADADRHMAGYDALLAGQVRLGLAIGRLHDFAALSEPGTPR